MTYNAYRNRFAFTDSLADLRRGHLPAPDAVASTIGKFIDTPLLPEVLLLLLGVRPAEIGDLDRDDYDPGRGRLWIARYNPKTIWRERFIILPFPVQVWLEASLRSRENLAGKKLERHDALVVNRYGARWTPASLAAAIRRSARSLGMYWSPPNAAACLFSIWRDAGLPHSDLTPWLGLKPGSAPLVEEFGMNGWETTIRRASEALEPFFDQALA